MKSIIKLSCLSALVAFTFGCKEDFLDKGANASQFLTSVQFEEAAAVDPGLVEATIAGTYSATFNTRTGGTTNHDDFGRKGYDIYGDMLSGDLALSQSVYGWYRADITEFTATQDFTRTRNYMPWRYYYRIIRSANLIIDGLGGNDAVPANPLNKALMGQAKTLRADSYFWLTQFYQKEYDAAEEILPLYSSGTDINGPKVSAATIYDLMEKDLTDAISLLNGFNRANKTQINQDVARGVYAYVLGARGKYAEAYVQASTVANSGNYSLMSGAELTGGFNDVSTPGWMWGVDLNVDIGLGLVSWWGQMDYYSYSYPAFGDFKSIDQGLFDAIPANDARKAQFFNNPAFGEHLLPLFKFYDEGRTRYGAVRVVRADYVYMRVAEMYLLAAEAAARSNQPGTARTWLKRIVSQRVPDASYIDGLSGTALTDEIYLQTRIELWGEGKSYLAMKRNKATISRGSNHLSFVGVPIPYNDERLTFEIPQAEIRDNPFISSQNN